MGMLEVLKQYYRSNGIDPLDFRCPHWGICSQGSEGNMAQAKSAFVGTEYEKGELPRLLFLSLDPGNSDADPNNRTVESVKVWEETRCKPSSLPKHKHWYRTHELALKLLEQLGPSINAENSHLYFAHANSAKCSSNHINRAAAPLAVFNNCQGYIRGEIAILSPDILVTQGKCARMAVEQEFGFFEIPVETSSCRYRRVTINKRPVLWFPTPHPNNWGLFNKQRRDCWGKWPKIVTDEWDRQARCWKPALGG